MFLGVLYQRYVVEMTVKPLKLDSIQVTSLTA